MMVNGQCTHVLERVCKHENVGMWTDDGGWRIEKVNQRTSSWEKMLGRLAITPSQACSLKKRKDPMLPWKMLFPSR